MLHTSGHFAGFIGGSSPVATVEGARRPVFSHSIASPYKYGRRVRPWPSSSLCYANMRRSPALGSPLHPISAVFAACSAHERVREAVSGVGVSWTSQQDTPQGAVVYGSKEVNCRYPLSLI
jgi:hypothetical protein